MEVSTLEKAKELTHEIELTQRTISHFLDEEDNPKFDAATAIETLEKFLNYCSHLTINKTKGEIAYEMLTKFVDDLKIKKRGLEKEFKDL